MATAKTSVALLCALALLGTVACDGDDGDDRAVERRERRALERQRPDRPDGETLDRLRAAAERDGTTRIIVGLKAPFRPEGELEVTGRDGQRAGIAAAQDTLTRALPAPARPIRRFATIPYVALAVDATALEFLAGSDLVASIEEDGVFRLFQEAGSEEDPDDGEDPEGGIEEPGDSPGAPGGAEPADVPWGVSRVNAPAAWDRGLTGTGQTVVVIDNGVDSAHPYLEGRVVEEACFTNGNCPAGETGAGSAASCRGSEECGHGTHVAGIAAGASGVAREATIIAVKVFDGADANLANVLAAMDWVTAEQVPGHRIAAVNMSLGGYQFDDYCATSSDRETLGGSLFDAAANLRSYGAVSVLATGNNGWKDSVHAPACIANALAVGNTTRGDDVNRTSNSWGNPMVLAPGTDIPSSMPGGTYGELTGTSMATPHVAGALAVLAQALPGQTTAHAEQRIEALRASGVAVADRGNGISHPLIDLSGAVEAAASRLR